MSRLFSSVFVLLLFFHALVHLQLSFVAAIGSSLTLTMNTESVKAEVYYCTSVRVPDDDNYIVKYEPHFNAAHEHHVLIFGCDDYKPEKRWICSSTATVCKNSFPKTLYAWAKQAEGLTLPKDTGFKVGRSAGVQSIVMQVHIKVPPPPKDPQPSLTLSLTSVPQRFLVGIFLIGGSGHGLVPEQNQVKVKSACYYNGPVIHPFAFRTHAHSHGVVISGYVVRGQHWTLIGQRSPQDPQAFYPAASESLTVRAGDMLAAACTYDTSNEHTTTHFGFHSEDEMCNFYIMYYTSASDINKLNTDECWESASTLSFPSSAYHLQTHSHTTHKPHTHPTIIPTEFHTTNKQAESTGETQGPHITTTTQTTQATIKTETQPTIQTETQSTETITTQTTSHPPTSPPLLLLNSSSTMFVPAEDWPSTRGNLGGASILGGVTLGQVSAVAVDRIGNVYVLHRASRVWDLSSFSYDNQYLHRSQGAIPDPVVLKLTSQGSLIATWGRDIFYLPHGLTIDSQDNLWITDVARHQVTRAPAFSTHVKKDPPLVLGRQFSPGAGSDQFCKPTAVAVDERSGVFYVADGYCNSRIMVFKLNGEYITAYSSPVAGTQMFVPHSLALSDDGRQLYVADRQNSRILQFDTVTGVGSVFSGAGQIQGFVYAISFTQSGDGKSTWPLYAINGSYESMRAVAFTINSTGNVVATWSPHEGFTRPHDISSSSDSAVYVAEIGPNLVWKMVPVPNVNPLLPDVSQHSPDEQTTHPQSPPHPSLPSHHEEKENDDYVCPTPPPPPPIRVTCRTQTISLSLSISHSSTSSSLLVASMADVPITSSSSLFVTSMAAVPIALSSSPSLSPSCLESCVVYVASSSTHTNVVLRAIFVTSMVVPVLLALSIFIGCYLYHRRFKARRKVSEPIQTTRIALDTILGPARKGFHPVKNYDSDSGEEEEMFIFSKS